MVWKALQASRWNINKIIIVSKSGQKKASDMYRAKSICGTKRARIQEREEEGGQSGRRCSLKGRLETAEISMPHVNDFTIYSR